jgi:hypothetical protein
MVLGIGPPENIENLLFNNWYPTRDNTFRSFLLTGAAAIYWSIWLTRNEVCIWQMLAKKLSCKYFTGNTLASVLGSIAVVWGAEETGVGGMSQDGESGYAFLHVLRIVLYFKNWVLSWLCFVTSVRLLWWLFYNKLVRFLSLGDEARFFPLCRLC